MSVCCRRTVLTDHEDSMQRRFTPRRSPSSPARPGPPCPGGTEATPRRGAAAPPGQLSVPGRRRPPPASGRSRRTEFFPFLMISLCPHLALSVFQIKRIKSHAGAALRGLCDPASVLLLGMLPCASPSPARCEARGAVGGQQKRELPVGLGAARSSHGGRGLLSAGPAPL